MQHKPKDGKDIVDIAVSCDGTWQRRGYARCVTVIFIENGQVLDVEPLGSSAKHARNMKMT